MISVVRSFMAADFDGTLPADPLDERRGRFLSAVSRGTQDIGVVLLVLVL